MNNKAWPFLVSRNQYLDYRTVVAPSFISQAGITNLLARAAGGKLTQPGHAVYREIKGFQEVENKALVFRVVEILKNEIYPNEPNEILKDPYGREIFFIEGIVIENNTRAKVTYEDFDNTHKQLLKCYRQFWEHSDPFQAPVQSLEPFYLQIDYNSSQLVILDEMEPFIIKTKAPRSIEKYKSLKRVYSEDINQEISSVIFAPDSNLLAVRYNQVVLIWNWGKQKEVCRLGKPLKGLLKFWTTSSVAFNKNKHCLASAMINIYSQEIINLWDVNTQKISQDFLVHQALEAKYGCILALTFSPNGEILASSSKDKNKTIKLWNISTEQQILTLRQNSPARSISISPNSKFLASGHEDGTIKIWNIETGEEISSIQAHSSWIQSLAFSSDSRILASGGDENAWDDELNYIRIWKINTQGNINTEESISLLGHKKQVNSIAFSPDGQTLVSGSNDRDIKLWNLRTRETICTLSEHTDVVTSVAFSPDGQTLASGSKDGTFKIWQ
jgi:WD40 repeat protein